MKSWPKVRLGNVLKPISREEKVDASKEYRMLGVRLEGRGPFLRETINGSQTAATKLFRVQQGDFIYSRLFAWRGAFGVITDGFDGCYVSGEFPTFKVIPDKIEAFFLSYWFRLRTTLAQVDENCSGSTPLTRNRFKEQFFLTLEIPLPPLQEQQRIVARIEELSSLINEARSLRQQAIEEIEILLRSIIAKDAETKLTAMGEIVRLKSPDVKVKADETYQFAGVYSFGRGVFKAQKKTGMEFAYPQLTTLRTANFVYPKLMAWEGAFGIVPAECDGCVVSTEFPVFEVNEERVFPEILDSYFKSPAVWPEISNVSTGTNVRRRRLNPQDFLNYQIPLPSRETQIRFKTANAKAEALKIFQSKTSAELDALLPAILDRAFRGELV